MTKGQTKIVVSDWLYQRAKAMEKRFLKKYGTSLTAGSICGELEKSTALYYADGPIVEIDYTKYKQICADIENRLKAEAEKNGE